MTRKPTLAQLTALVRKAKHRQWELWSREGDTRIEAARATVFEAVLVALETGDTTALRRYGA